MSAICDACLRPTGAHMPYELEDCAKYDPWNCVGCNEPLPVQPWERKGDLCVACATMEELTRCGGIIPYIPQGLIRENNAARKP